VTRSAEPTAAGLALLDARLRVAVQRAAATESGADDALRGLYISDQQALDRAGSDGAPGAGDAEARMAAAGRRLGLDALEQAVLAVCAAPELHPRYGFLYAYLQDDVTRRLASPRLVADLLEGEGTGRTDVLACFGPIARLARAGALTLLATDAPGPLADRPVKVADRLAAYLLGAGGALAETGAPAVLTRVDAQGDAGRPDVVAEVERLLGVETRLPLVACGPDAAAVVAAAAGPLVLLEVRALESAGALPDATLAAALEERRLCLSGLEHAGPADHARLLQAIDEREERTLVLGRSRADALILSDRTALLVDVPMPTFAERRSAWSRHAQVGGTDDVAAKFRLSVEQIVAAAEVGRVTARTRGAAAPDRADLDLGARYASVSKVGELAASLDAPYGWDDLVVPERQRVLLRSISAYLRHRDRVLSEWGYERTVARTQGLKILFAGESGTGKTMGAQVLGAELGLDLFRVDLATVVSKYIGETEKNLERIFAAADGSNAILFFDEADALFGKRSEVSDSHDRYANLEVAYLLQRMELYPGAVILATNFKRNIDDAFVRRLDFVVDFPFPEPDDRRRIWRLVLPPEAPVAADVDLEFLATRFKLSGGAIRNCSLAAAFQAADEDAPISMRHLIRAVAQEYGKQGRLTLEADFAGFHELVRG